MFRTMRRSGQELDRETCTAILEKATSGVLAVSGDDDYPYAVPLSYVYADGKVYFHCATAGHKLDAIRACDKVSFCVIEQDEVIPARFTTHYRSVILFGRARVIESREEKLAALIRLAQKYSPNQPHMKKEIDDGFDRLHMVELTVEQMSGKECRELAENRKAKQEI